MQGRSGVAALALVTCATIAAFGQGPLGPAKTLATKIASTRKIFTAHPPTVRKVSILQGKTSVEVHIEGNGALKPVAKQLSGPERILVDLPDVGYGRTTHLPVNAGDVQGVRVGLFQSNPPVTRVVVDLSHPHTFRVLTAGKVVILQIETTSNSPPEQPPSVVEARAAAPPMPPAAVQPQQGTASAETRVVESSRSGAPAAIKEPEPVPQLPAEEGVPEEQQPQAAGPPSSTNPAEPASLPQVATVYVPPANPVAPELTPTEPAEEETTAHQAAKGNKPGVVRNIAVSREKDGVEVHIEGNKPLRASATTLSSPERIVIDLSDVRFDRPRRIPVNAGDVRDVNVALYLVNPLTTRVVVNLERAHAYHLVNSGTTVTVRIDTEETKAADRPAR